MIRFPQQPKSHCTINSQLGSVEVCCQRLERQIQFALSLSFSRALQLQFKGEFIKSLRVCNVILFTTLSASSGANFWEPTNGDFNATHKFSMFYLRYNIHIFNFWIQENNNNNKNKI